MEVFVGGATGQNPLTVGVSAMATFSNFWANTSSITNRTRTIRTYCIMTSLDSGTCTTPGSSPSYSN
jgi:hypothetical protein